MSGHLKKSTQYWKFIFLLCLIALAACQTSTTPTGDDQSDPTPEIPTEVIPTPTETEDPGYHVLNSNAIDPSVSMEWVLNPMWEPVYDFMLGADFTVFIPPGFVIAYEYGREAGENLLYLLYAAPEGIIKVQVDTLIKAQSGIVQSVKQMTEEEMTSFLRDFDAYFLAAKETGFVPYALRSDGTTLGLITIGGEAGTDNCLMTYDLEAPVGEFCAFDPSKTTLSSEETFDALIGAFTPFGDLSLAELLNDEYEVFAFDENASIFFQFAESTEGSSSTW